jgi:hypothetical protein
MITWNPATWGPVEWFDFYICVILTIEYIWGRSDTDIRAETKKRSKIRREKYRFDELTTGEMK